MAKRLVRGYYLPESKVVVELRVGEPMPPKEEFAWTIHRIKNRAGAYAMACVMHRVYSVGYPMIMARRQAEALVAKYPQFEIFG